MTTDRGFDDLDFPWTRYRAAADYLRAIKPWWSPYLDRMNVIPITIGTPLDGNQYTAASSMDRDLNLFIDQSFAANTPLHIVAGSIEHGIQRHVRNTWGRMEWLTRSEWNEWASIAFDLEINSSIETEFGFLELRNVHAICSRSSIFTEKDCERWNVTEPPSLGDTGWQPEHVNLPPNLSAEEYYRLLTEPPESSQPSEPEPEPEEDSENGEGSNPQGAPSPHDDTDQDEDGGSKDGPGDEQGDSTENDDTENGDQGSSSENPDHLEDGEGSGKDDNSDASPDEDSSSSRESQQGSEDESPDAQNGSPESGESDPDEEERGGSGKAEDFQDAGGEDDSSDTSQSDEQGDTGEEGGSEQSDQDDSGGGDQDGSNSPGDGQQGQTPGEMAQQLKDSSPSHSWWSQECPHPSDRPDRSWEQVDEDKKNGPGDIDPEEMQDELIEAMEPNERFGLSPGESLIGLKRERERILGVDVESVFRRLLTRMVGNVKIRGASDLSYSVRNPNQPKLGPVYMGLHDYSPTIYILQDVSGSMTYGRSMSRCIDLFERLTLGVLRNFGDSVTWITADAGVQQIGRANRVDKHVRSAYSYGGGGTVFSDVMEDISRGELVHEKKRYKRPDILIILTDCGFEWPWYEEPPKIPVLVCSTKPLERVRRRIPRWMKENRDFMHFYAE